MKNPLEPLNQNQIQQHLTSAVKDYWGEIKIFDSIDSTNNYLLAQGPNPRVCCAEQQTQGRGRLQRSWFSPLGCNLYCSMWWRFYGAANALAGLSLSVGIALAKALTQYGVVNAKVKWPNDIWVNDAKCAGILIEMAKLQDDTCDVVIGMGVNGSMSHLTDVPIEKKWTDLFTLTQQTVQRNKLLALILNELHSALQIFQAQGLAPTVKEWKQWDALVNHTVIMKTLQKELQGQSHGIDNSGRFLLMTESGMQAFLNGCCVITGSR